MTSTEKIYYSYEDIHKFVKRVSQKIRDDNYEPDVLIAIGGGGYIPGRILRNEFKKPIIGITINFYDENDQIQEKPNIHQWVNYNDVKNKKILIVDEVDDTRKTLHYIVDHLKFFEPKEIGVVVLNNKLKPKLDFEDVRYYSAQETEDKWIVYPWDGYDGKY